MLSHGVMLGVYKDMAPKNGRTPDSYEICRVAGVATHEIKDDARVIIERDGSSGERQLEHLTLEEFHAKIEISDTGHATARFVFVHADCFQD